MSSKLLKVHTTGKLPGGETFLGEAAEIFLHNCHSLCLRIFRFPVGQVAKRAAIQPSGTANFLRPVGVQGALQLLSPRTVPQPIHGFRRYQVGLRLQKPLQGCFLKLQPPQSFLGGILAISIERQLLERFWLQPDVLEIFFKHRNVGPGLIDPADGEGSFLVVRAQGARGEISPAVTQEHGEDGTLGIFRVVRESVDQLLKFTSQLSRLSDQPRETR